MDALIGDTGFVGSNVLRQRAFDACFHSTNIGDIEGRSFDLVVCAGASAVKWKANKEPAADLANLQGLMDRLAKVRARRFVLVSTIDVYPTPAGVDETTPIVAADSQPYGKHRRMLELFCRERFDATIIRLPGLFGKGLKKNVIYDLLHDNLVEQIHPDGSFQYYDLEWLWRDVERVLAGGHDLVNFATEPVLTKDIAVECFGRELVGRPNPPARYDMWTTHAALWGAHGHYLADRPTILERIRSFVRFGAGVNRLAVSNIAWEPDQDDAVGTCLRAAGFAGVEIAPTKRWQAPLEASDAEIADFRGEWEARGARIVAMQALLFGRPDLLIFGDAAVRARTAEYLKGICRLGGKLGAGALVFGSPKNRARGAVSFSDARAIAIEFFRDVGRAAAEAGTCLCIEANPPQYACDFVTTSAEALELVDAVATPGFGLHLDVAGMHLAGEDVPARIRAAAGHIQHFHVSAPNLGHVAATSPIDYAAALRALRDTGYDRWISIEMRAADDKARNVERVAETLEFVKAELVR